MNPTNRTPVLSNKYSVSAIEPKHETTPAQGYNAGADGVGSREYLLARMIGGVSESPALPANNSTKTTQNAPDASEIPCRNPLKKCDGMAKYVMPYGSGSAYQCPKCRWAFVAGGGK